jgi:hypothetical protein
MFRRCRRKVHAAHWGNDGSLKVAKGNQKLSRGNTFVIAAVVLVLPFLDRPIALPELARLWRKGGSAKTVLAREMIEMIAAYTQRRTVHLVADGAYLCTELRRLPAHANHLAGHRPNVIRERRDRAPWYTTKRRLAVIPRHRRQAPSSPDRRPISARSTLPGHTRRNPRCAAGLGASSRVAAKS